MTESTADRPYPNAPLTPIPREVRVAGGKKAAARNLAIDPDFYKKLGRKGGSAPHAVRGFQAMSPEKLREAGRKGGLKSRKVRAKS